MHHNRFSALQTIECGECGGRNVIEFLEGHLVCADCGFVITQPASSYNEDGHKRGKGSGKQPRISLKQEECKVKNGMSSKASFSLNIKFEEMLRELRISDSLERIVALTLYEITKIVSDLSLSEEALVEAVQIYGELAKKCSFKGKSMRALCSAIVYVASRRAGVPCGLREIAHVAGVSSSKIFKCYEFVLGQLDEIASTGIVEAYIRRVCGLLGVRNQTVEIIEGIMSAISRDGYRNGKSLPGLVSAGIYIASILVGEHMTQREIAEATRVSEATIRVRYRDIIKNLLFVLSI